MNVEMRRLDGGGMHQYCLWEHLWRNNNIFEHRWQNNMRRGFMAVWRQFETRLGSVECIQLQKVHHTRMLRSLCLGLPACVAC